MNPLAAVAQLFHKAPQEAEFLGSCFALWDNDYFITASHCVGNLEPGAVLVATTSNGLVIRHVEHISKHDTADLAVLRAERAHDMTQPFQRLPRGQTLGDDIYAYGYPENVFGENARQPTPRLFKGHFQRLFKHTSYLGFRYPAGELNFPCPGGLSGGPVFSVGSASLGYVDGVVTENLESTTFLHSVEEIQRDGVTTRERYHTVINYGVALLLPPFEEWLRSNIPTAPPKPKLIQPR